MLSEKHKCETHTGSLGGDTPGYLEAARVEERHPKLRLFTGKDGARTAHAFGQFILAQLPGQARAQRWLSDNGYRPT